IFLGEDFVSALGAGQASIESASLDISSLNIPAGTYYVGAIVDHQDEVAESDEVENHCCFYTRLRITGHSNKPDLRCKQKGLFVVQGCAFNVIGAQIRNVGSATAAASEVGFYLSTDQNFTTADYFLGSTNVGALAPNQLATISWSANLPSGVPAGTYYLGFIVDYANVVIESNEANNNECGWANQIHVSGGGSNNTNDCACTDYFQDFCEDFDSYSTAALGPQSNCWTTWSGQEGTRQDGEVRASGGNNYLKVKATQATGGHQDVVLRLGDRTSGKYQLRFKMFLFSGDKGYYNVLHEFTPGDPNFSHAYEVFFNGNGTGRVRHGGINQVFRYNMNAWNDVIQEIDLDTDEVTLIIEGQFVARWRFSEAAGSTILGTNKLASMNFYPVDGSYEFYVDELSFERVTNLTGGDSTESRNALPEVAENLENVAGSTFDFDYYPNPAKDDLNVAFNLKTPTDISVEIVNTMGQVLQTQTFQNVTLFEEVLDVSTYPAGVYYIKIQTEEAQAVKQVVIVD
ncbi:MAG: CARDB domain-containing protein, partial [Bacteroidota bacterium]